MPTPRKTPAKKSVPRKQTPAKPPLTGIAAKRAQIKGEDGQVQHDPYAPTAWGSDESNGALVDLQVPSGQMILAQRPGPEGLMAAGMLDDLDMLGTILPKVMGGKSRAKNFNSAELLKSPEMLRQAMRLMDRVLCYVVVKPEITPEPDDPRKKERGKIYPSTVSLEDKTFIFNWAAGGTQNLAQFRQQYEESVAGVESVEDMEDSPV